jgi:hypothetical protein
MDEECIWTLPRGSSTVDSGGKEKKMGRVI